MNEIVSIIVCIFGFPRPFVLFFAFCGIKASISSGLRRLVSLNIESDLRTRSMQVLHDRKLLSNALHLLKLLRMDMLLEHMTVEFLRFGENESAEARQL